MYKYFALFALICATSAFRMSSEQMAVTFEGVQSEMVEPLASLMEITKVDETAEVEALLKKVQKTTTSNRNVLIQDLANITAVYKKTRATLEAQIKVLKAKIADLKSKISAKESQIADTEKRIKDAEDAITQAQKDIVSENKRRKAFHAKELTIQKNNAAGVAACKDALAYMAQFAKKDLTNSQLIKAKKGTTVFAEMGSTLRAHFERIRESLDSASTEVMMVETLMEAALAGVNDKLIAKIDAAIKNLQASLEANIAQSKADDAADLKKHKALIAELLGVISTNEAILADLRPKLVKYKKELKALKAALKTNEGLLATCEATLKKVIAAYLAEKARYEKIIKKLAADIKALDYAIAYLDEQTYAKKATALNRSGLMKP